jgi:hypothetical protein
MALNYIKFLILRFDYSFYIDVELYLFVSQSDNKVCNYRGIQRISYQEVVNDDVWFHNN